MVVEGHRLERGDRIAACPYYPRWSVTRDDPRSHTLTSGRRCTNSPSEVETEDSRELPHE